MGLLNLGARLTLRGQIPQGGSILAVGASPSWRGAIRRSLERPGVSISATMPTGGHIDVASAARDLNAGLVVVVFTEGDVDTHREDVVYRGYADLASLVLASRAPVFPAAVTRAGESGARSHSLEVGDPLGFGRFCDVEAPIAELDGWMMRTITDQIQIAIAELVRRPYRDVFAHDVEHTRTFTQVISRVQAWRENYRLADYERRRIAVQRREQEAELAARLDQDDMEMMEQAALAAQRYAERLAAQQDSTEASHISPGTSPGAAPESGENL